MKIETLPCHKLRNPIGENIPIYRMQLGFSIGNKTKNKTKGSIFVLFNAGDKPFYLERKISELEIGQTYYFDFLSYKVKEIKDIQFLKGRVKFLGTNTKGEYVTDKAPMHDSMIVVFGTDGSSCS